MSNDNKDPTKYKDLENHFANLVKSITEYFPRVDEVLILDILRLEYYKPDWQGTTTIEIQYSKKNAVKLDEKKDKLYDKFHMLPMEKNENTLRFKAKKMYLKDIEELFDNDLDIVRITGSARSSEDDQYPSSQ
jgi:hypothetical protein